MIKIFKPFFFSLLAMFVATKTLALAPSSSDFLDDLDQTLTNLVAYESRAYSELLDIQYAVLGQFFLHALRSNLLSIANKDQIVQRIKLPKISINNLIATPRSIYDQHAQDIFLGRNFYDRLCSSLPNDQKIKLIQQFYKFAQEHGIVILSASNDRSNQIRFFYRDAWVEDQSFSGESIEVLKMDQDDEIDASNGNVSPQRTLVSFENNELKLHPSFTKETYEDIKEYIDLSQAVAKRTFIHSKEPDNDENQAKLLVLNSRIRTSEAVFYGRGWRQFTPLSGCTGRRNQIPDHAAIVAYHPNRNVILVAFHGSLNEWDWEANYDFLPYNFCNTIPTMHRGFATNYLSVENDLRKKLSSVLQEIPSENMSKTWVLFVGHSKGAGISTIAAVRSRSWLNDGIFHDVNIGAILFSSPRVFLHDNSRTHVHKTLGKGNIIRINVFGDFVTSIPPKFLGYRSVGVLFLDSVSHVRERMKNLARTLEKETNTASQLKNFWQAFHYVCNIRGGGGGEYTPDLTLEYEGLGHAFDRANTKLGGNGNLTSSFFEMPFAIFEDNEISTLTESLLSPPCLQQ